MLALDVHRQRVGDATEAAQQAYVPPKKRTPRLKREDHPPVVDHRALGVAQRGGSFGSDPEPEAFVEPLGAGIGDRDDDGVVPMAELAGAGQERSA
jgi:hypothetical protein